MRGGQPALQDWDGKIYSGLNLNQDKATKPQTVQIVRQGEATPYWFKFNPLYFSLPLPFPLDLADGCGMMPVGTPEPVAAERLQARFADKNDNAGLSQALFDFAA